MLGRCWMFPLANRRLNRHCSQLIVDRLHNNWQVLIYSNRIWLFTYSRLQSSPAGVPLPSSPSLSTPTASIRVSISTPQTNIPSVHTVLDTVPSDAGRSEILTHDINRLLQYLHDLDQIRGQETHEIADTVRAIRDELYDLSDHLRRPDEPHLDRSVGESTAIPVQQPVVAPRPILLTPPPFRVPSPGSLMRSDSFLSSHHSDDDIWISDHDSPSPTPPPESFTPPSPSPSSTSTARPSRSLADIREILEGIKDEVDKLGGGQKDTNDILGDIRGRIPPPPDPEVGQRLQRIEDLLQRLLDQPGVIQVPTEIRPISHVTESTEPSSEPSSDYTAELDRLLQRFRDAAGRPAIPEVLAPQPVPPALSLDDELAAMLRAPIPSFPRDVEGPPPLKPFEYHPAARATRPRSASPTLVPPRPSTVPISAPVVFDDEPRRPRRVRRPDSEISYEPVIPPGPPRPPRPPGEVQVLGDPGRPPTTLPPPEPVFVSSLPYPYHAGTRLMFVILAH
jgi:hypothetical protein